jgi:hypothetical protein
MNHLARAGVALFIVLVFIFIGLRIMPVPDWLVDYGFHPEEAEVNAKEWASLPIQYIGSAVCVDCHQNKYTIWQQGNHRTVACESCHGPGRDHTKTGETPTIIPSREFCGRCHSRLISRPVGFSQVDMKDMGGDEVCVVCHDPHEPRQGMPPEITHDLEGRTNCQTCHGSHESVVMLPPQIPHPLDGRTECESCHGPHSDGQEVELRIPHSLEGRSDCLLCHNAEGIRPFPEDHIGRMTDTCLKCHWGE